MANADGSIVIETRVDVERAEKDLAKLKTSIKKTESDIKDLTAQKMPLVKELERLGLEADEAAKKLDMMKNALAGTFSDEEIKEQAETAKYLGREFDSVQRKIASYDSKIQAATQKLNRQTEEAGDLAQQINSVSKASRKMAEAQERAQKSAKKFALRLREVVRSALVFTIITRSLASLRDWTKDVITSNDEARESIARLKGALLTLAQPLVDVIIPATVAVADALTRILLVVANLFSTLSGSTLEESQKAANALHKEQQMIQGVGDAAKEASKQLASFDEINKLNGESAKDTTIAPSFDFSSDKMSKNADGLAAMIATIGAAFLTWKISDSVSGWFEALGDGKFNNVGKVSAGIASIATALGMISWHASQVSTGKIDPNSLKSGIVSAIEAAVFAVGGAALLSVAGISFGTGVLITLPIAITLIDFTIGLSDEKGQAAISNLKRIIEGVFGGEDWGTIVSDLVAGEETEETLWSKINKVFSSPSAFSRAKDVLLDTIRKFGDREFINTLDDSIGGRIRTWFQGIFPNLFNDSDAGANARKKLLDLIKFITNPMGSWLETYLKEPIKKAVQTAWDWITGLFDYKHTPNFTGFGPDYSWLFKSRASVGDVPGLASGSVIPPNREFLAVLGDNKTEAEVVSPLSTIEQAVENVLSRKGGGGETTLVLDGDLAALARVFRPYILKEDKRVGVTVVTK